MRGIPSDMYTRPAPLPILALTTLLFMSVCDSHARSLSRSEQQSGPQSEPLSGSPSDVYNRAVSKVLTIEDEVIAFRHDLHRNPEVSREEARTATKVTESLRRLGFDVWENIGGYGVVGVLQTGRPGPIVAFRADMDATAQEAKDDVSYASQVEGVHHICGHDMHTAIGIALAEGLSHVRAELSGTVMLIFQPEEEAGTGADDMIADGLFETLTPNALFGLHTAPFEVGEIYSKPREMMSGRAVFAVQISGAGDVNAAAREIRSRLEALATVGYPEILAFGSQDFVSVDIAPTRVSEADASLTVSGYLMSARTAQRPALKSRVFDAVDLKMNNVDIDIQYSQALEGVNNDPLLLARASTSIGMITDELAVETVPGIVPAFSEDFGSFQRVVPGVFFFLGVNNSQKGTVGFPHSADYIADDAAILVGTKAMLAAMLDHLLDGVSKSDG